jgi:hypothetical protein
MENTNSKIKIGSSDLRRTCSQLCLNWFCYGSGGRGEANSVQVSFDILYIVVSFRFQKHATAALDSDYGLSGSFIPPVSTGLHEKNL